MFLIDTVVFSELYKRRRHPGFVRWLSVQDEKRFFLSTVTLGEIERGIEGQRRRNPPFAAALLVWLDRSIEIYSDRILPVTTEIARRWGVLGTRIGHDSVNLLIASTALEHGLTVATRNIRHFTRTGVATEDPFVQGD
jgi:toxin FitB